MPCCKYTTVYFDYRKKRNDSFKCPEEALEGSQLCLFHDDKYYISNGTEVLEKILEKVERAAKNNEELYCVGYHIPGNAAFIYEFKAPVYFNSANFHGSAEFSDAVFNDIDFLDAIFQDAHFVKTTFNSIANFRGVTFNRIARFWQCKFDTAYFDEAIFQGQAEFLEAEFREFSYFSSVKFHNNAIFFRSMFHNGAKFSQSRFYGLLPNIRLLHASHNREGLACFSNVKFQKMADFTDAEFYISTDFSESEFEHVSFTHTKFENALFIHTKFNTAYFTNSSFREASFSYAKFREYCEFNLSKFNGDSDFHEAVIDGKSSFHGIAFQKIAFTNAKFNEMTFYGTNFTNITDFSRAEFNKVDFSKSKFWNTTNFSQTIFNESANFSDVIFDAKTSFENVLFQQGEKVLFNVYNLTKVSFINSDVTRVRFGESVTWGLKNRFKLFDEEEFEKSVNLDKFRGLFASYRNLRENYEYRLRYDEAGKFFIREMELKRNYREVQTHDGIKVVKNSWLRRQISLTGWYYHLSRYGEDLVRPTLAGIVIVLLSTLPWLTQSNPNLEPTFFNTNSSHISNAIIISPYSKFIGFMQIGNETQWIKSFERATADFLPLLPLGSNFKVGILDYIIKIISGALIFGLLAIALRRKFERKFRH